MSIQQENMRGSADRPVQSLIFLWAFLFLVWLAINASIQTSIVVTGLIFSLVLARIFTRRSRVWHISITPRKIFHFLAYTGTFLAEMVKANINMLRYVYAPRIEIQPGIVKIDMRLRSPLGRLALANSIALTPGSLVMDITDDAMFIHWLDVQTTDRQEATRLIAGPFEKHLGEVFG